MTRETENLAGALARLRADLAAVETPPLTATARAALRAAAASGGAAGAPATTTISDTGADGAAPSHGAQRPRGPFALRWPRLATWSGVVLAGVVLTVSTLLMVLPPQPDAGTALHLAQQREATPAETRHGARGFVPVLPPERWPDGAEGAAPAWIVPAELSGERLALLGLPYDPARAGARLPAELLVHPSGAVLAVRLLQ